MVSFEFGMAADQTVPLHVLSAPEHYQHGSPAGHAHAVFLAAGLQHALDPIHASTPIRGHRNVFGVRYASRPCNGRADAATVALKAKNCRTDIEMRTQLFHSAMRSKMMLHTIDCEHWRSTFALRSTHEVFIQALLAEALECRKKHASAEAVTQPPSAPNADVLLFQNSLRETYRVVRAMLRASSAAGNTYSDAIAYISSQRIFDR